MGVRVEIDGKFYRRRRGELVVIPEAWVGVTTHPQRIRKRKSKLRGQNDTRKGRGKRR